MSTLGPQGRQAELNQCFATTLKMLADTHYLLAKKAISAFGAREPETWLIPY
ncbi:MAG TPA: hypothetical protein VFT87_05425 [Candidatus Saccharimonadales bacterium]|nr:hypothetical protein [Candidatus Saccharimonadales bacterium]